MTKEHGNDHLKVRNSGIRKLTGGPLHYLSAYTHYRHPHRSPNDVSAEGVKGVAETAHEAVELAKTNPELLSLEQIKLIIKYVYYSLKDVEDGALARYLKSIGIEHDGNLGQLVDASADRLQELILALSRLAQAFNRHDLLGALLSLTSALTNGIPSYLRAHAEASGHPVPETGGNLLAAVGTRGGRFVTSGFSTFIPQTQKIIDALNTFANLYTSYRRYKIIQETKHQEPTLQKSTQELAIERKKVMGTLLGISAISALGYTAYRLYERHKK